MQALTLYYPMVNLGNPAVTPRKPLPTLDDVARHAGVSTATVSRCLNNSASVRGETRRRVTEAVEALGYTPHFGGRALASNRTNTIGAIIPTMENAIFARGVQALQESLATSGVTLLVASCGYDPVRELEQVGAMLGRGVDGLMLIGEARLQKTYDLLLSRGVPYVLAWNFRRDSPHIWVGFNNRAAMRQLTESVIARGHTRIAMIAGITQFNDRAVDRVAGARDAVEAAGLKLPPKLVIEAEYVPAAGGAALRKLMSRKSPPTAIICGNDVLAAGALCEARALGLALPGDLTIVGFDDIELASLVEPPLTTVHVPHRRMGQTVAKLLLAMRDQETVGQSVEFQTEVVERGSVATLDRASGE